MNGYPDNRSEAKRQGELHYHTGKPCKRGHLAPRLTCNGHCCTCARGYDKEDYQAKLDLLDEEQLRTVGYPTNPDKAKELNLEFYYTGKLCTYGHDSVRYTSIQTCLQCRTGKNLKQWRLKRAVEKLAEYIQLQTMGLATTKEKAQELGHTYFYNGVCGNGHNSVRYTLNRCFACSNNGRNKQQSLIKRLAIVLKDKIQMETVGYPKNYSKSKALGLKLYDPKEPCEKGHYALRYTYTSNCFQCITGYSNEKELQLAEEKQLHETGYAITREKAEELGHKYFFPSRLCKWGHNSIRYINGSCYECSLIRSEERRERQRLLNRLVTSLANKVQIDLIGYPINADKARKAGYEFYFTGKRCTRGHYELRRTRDRNCIKCREDQLEETREERKAYVREWCENNREYIKEKSRLYYEDNKELYKIRAKIHQFERHQATPLWAELEEIRQMEENKPEGYHLDHIIPIKAVNRNGEHVACGLNCLDNLQYLTAQENLGKSNRNPDLANNLIDDDNQGAA